MSVFPHMVIFNKVRGFAPYFFILSSKKINPFIKKDIC